MKQSAKSFGFLVLAIIFFITCKKSNVESDTTSVNRRQAIQMGLSRNGVGHKFQALRLQILLRRTQPGLLQRSL